MAGRRTRIRPALLLVALLALVLLTSCAAGPNVQRSVADPDGSVAGFWQGLWHGIIVPITFVVSLFKDTVNIYEVHNNGNWYNTGFMLGFGVLLGGGAGSKRIR